MIFQASFHEQMCKLWESEALKIPSKYLRKHLMIDGQVKYKSLVLFLHHYLAAVRMTQDCLSLTTLQSFSKRNIQYK